MCIVFVFVLLRYFQKKKKVSKNVNAVFQFSPTFYLRSDELLEDS